MRFAEGDFDFPGQWGLWEEALWRAINGRRGQQVLRDLERALVDLPEKRLMQGGLSDGKDVCAVGAYVAQKRVDAGEDRDAVLQDMIVPVDEWGDFDGWESEEKTISKGQRAGMQLTIIVAIAGRNDDLYDATPEERYERILGWVRERIIPAEVSA
jgi:hypothetical protein